MAPIIRRLFGFSEDAVAGGSEYDDLPAAVGDRAIPDATIFWPVTGGTLERNVERSDRNDEAFGLRASRPPLSLRQRPTLSIPVAAYLSVLKKGLRKCLGGTDNVTGSAPAAITHNLTVLGQGASALPAVHAQLVRDNLNHKVSGAVFNSVALNFPLDAAGTAEWGLDGLYHRHDPAAAPTPTFTGLSDEPLMLRDAQMFVDGSGTAIPDLQGFEFGFNNNVRPQWTGMRNIVTQTIGTPAKKKRQWFPYENRLGAAPDVTYAINHAETNSADELALEYAQVEKFVFECIGADMSTTPAATELLRITIFAGVHTGGGAEALSARDDITSRFEGGAFYSTTDSADIKVEVVDNVATATT